MRSRFELTLAALGCFASASATSACTGSSDAHALARAPEAAAPASTPIAATLVVAVGDVRAREAAAAAWTPAHAGLPLRALDAVQTMSAARAAIRFASDGTVADLAPGTTIEIPEQRRTEVRMRNIVGHVVARMPANGERGRSVQLELPPGTLVLESDHAAHGPARPGIEARVDVTPQHTEIAMLEGHARLASHGGGSVTIERSHYLRIDRNGAAVGGAMLAPARLEEPRADEIVHTRGTTMVAFAWGAVTGAVSYRLQAVSTDGAVVETTVAPPVRRASLSLPPGRYTWSVEPLAGGGAPAALEARTIVVELDRIPPALAFESPAPGASTREPNVLVRGRTEPTARVEVEGRGTPVRPDGSFEARVPVPRGLSNLVVRATDSAGNTRASSRTVLRE